MRASYWILSPDGRHAKVEPRYRWNGQPIDAIPAGAITVWSRDGNSLASACARRLATVARRAEERVPASTFVLTVKGEPVK